MRNWLKHIPRDWMLDQDGANAGEGGDQGEQELEDIELGTSGEPVEEASAPWTHAISPIPDSDFEILTRENPKTRELTENSRKKRKFNCDECDYVTTSDINLKVHKEYKRLGILEYPCDQCEYVAPQSSLLKSHKQSIHPESAFISTWPRKCVKCDYLESSRSDHNEHRKTAHLFTCFQCDYVAEKSSDLECAIDFRQHKLDHSTGTYPCDLCNYVGNQLFKFEAHKLSHKNRGSKKKYTCDQCEYFFTWSELEKHKKNFHDNIFPCDQCSYVAAQFSLLEKHKKGTEGCIGSHPSDQDDDVDELASSLNQRKQSVHEVTYPCGKCEFVATSFSVFQQHEQSTIHYPCDKCELFFTSLSALKQHRLSIH